MQLLCVTCKPQVLSKGGAKMEKKGLKLLGTRNGEAAGQFARGGITSKNQVNSSLAL